MKPYALLFCLLFAFTANLFTTAKAQVDVNDSLALVDLYNSTNGPGWYVHTNWLTEKPVNTWYGVEVTGTRVTIINLAGNRLINTIPSSIGNLIQLQYLELYSNQLSGSIPSSIGNLVNLRYLVLYNNQLSGSIPSSIGNLVNVQWISLEYNQLSDPIPASIGNLVNLNDFIANDNELSGSIPASIGNCINLGILRLENNQLSGSIPASIGNLNLLELGLHNNLLSGSIPSSICNLEFLGGLDLYNNQLSGTIPAFGNLIFLRSINLSNNQLSGAIPASIGNPVRLEWLDLSNNQLSGAIPSSMGNLVYHLVHLYLSNNKLSGAIPSSIGNLVHLHDLKLDHNLLSGAIPSSIGNLVKLWYLSLSDNQLSGAIPTSIDKLVKLVHLNLSNNQLSGSIPLSFRKLGNLHSIDLSHNQLAQTKNTDLMGKVLHPDRNVNVSYNHNTFNGFEYLARSFPRAIYAPQAVIPIHQHSNTLAVFAGGTLSNNTYRWFKVGDANSTTIKGDSTFKPTESGKYYVQATNVIATQLTLFSDTIDVTAPVISQNSIAAEGIKHIHSRLSIYPNPARDIIHVQVDGSATITLTNAAGKVVLTKAINNKGEINVSTLANGTYYLQNKTTGETQKVVIVH